MYIGVQVKYTLYSSDFNAIEFCRQSFEKYFNPYPANVENMVSS